MKNGIVAMITTFVLFGIGVGYFVISMAAHRCTESHFYHAHDSKIGNYKGWDCDKREWTRSKPDQDFMSMQELEKIGVSLK